MPWDGTSVLSTPKFPLGSEVRQGESKNCRREGFGRGTIRVPLSPLLYTINRGPLKFCGGPLQFWGGE